MRTKIRLENPVEVLCSESEVHFQRFGVVLGKFFVLITPHADCSSAERFSSKNKNVLEINIYLKKAFGK